MFGEQIEMRLVLSLILIQSKFGSHIKPSARNMVMREETVMQLSLTSVYFICTNPPLSISNLINFCQCFILNPHFAHIKLNSGYPN